MVGFGMVVEYGHATALFKIGGSYNLSIGWGRQSFLVLFTIGFYYSQVEHLGQVGQEAGLLQANLHFPTCRVVVGEETANGFIASLVATEALQGACNVFGKGFDAQLSGQLVGQTGTVGTGILLGHKNAQYPVGPQSFNS